MKTKEKLLLIDTHAVVHRAYHAIQGLTSPQGEPTGALFGLLTFLFKAIKDISPDYIVACFDLPGPTFRHESYSAYKAGRAKTEDALVSQLIRARDVLSAFGIPILELAGFEADDLLGTVVEKLKEKTKKGELEILIASGDMDTLQLVDGKNVRVYTLKRGISDTVIYDEEAVFARYGFLPKLLPDYKGLAGDPSDNIVGIDGIGDKTATSLITQFGSLENIFKKLKKEKATFLEKGIKERIVKLLEDGEDEAIFSKTLATIRRDAPIDFKLPGRFHEVLDLKKAEDIARDLAFRTLIPKIIELKKGTEIARAEASPETLETREFKECAIALWLLDSSKTNSTFSDILSIAESDNLPDAHKNLFARLKKEKLDLVYESMEGPLIDILSRAENHGFLINKKKLEELSLEYHVELSKIEKKIFELAGEEFNVASPKQLGVILFEKLNLSAKGLKKTAGGARSTRVSELEKLVGVHPIVEEIMSHREYSKLLSTYIDAIPKLLDENSRLHTHFIQTGTTTGRLSSEDPNLQNIPIKTELGRRIRNSFIVNKGFTLAAFDYSQIDLRSAALLSGDTKLIKFFCDGKDIHKAVSAEVFGVKEEDVTPEMRRRAKVINFGIIYGMGVNALKTNLGTSREEAQIFYEKYFERFPILADYLLKTKEDAHVKGFTTTFFGHRRLFPEINSRIEFIKAAAERMAVNAPIQGTSADIIKLAMIKVDQLIEKNRWQDDVHLLLQVHDELLYEIKDGLVSEAGEEIKRVMESVITEPLPFTIKFSKGPDWGNLIEC